MLILHIGLHKTGTTSLQAACFEAACNGALAFNYPTATEIHLGTRQHILVNQRWRDLRAHEALLRAAQRRDAPTLLSSEGISASLYAATPEQNLDALKILTDIFGPVTIFLTYRDERTYLKSRVRQFIELNGLPSLAGERGWYARFCKDLVSGLSSLPARLKDLGVPIVCASLEDAAASGNVPMYYLSRVGLSNANLPPVHLNKTSSKPLENILASFFRKFYFETSPQSPTPFSTEVAVKCSKAVRSLSIDEPFRSEFEEQLDRWIDSLAEEALKAAPHFSFDTFREWDSARGCAA